MNKDELKEPIPEDRDAVLAEMTIVDEALTSIKAQLDEARRLAAVGEGYDDIAWFTGAEAALRHHGIRRQALQAKLGKINREEKAKNIARMELEDARRVEQHKRDRFWQVLCAVIPAIFTTDTTPSIIRAALDLTEAGLEAEKKL